MILGIVKGIGIALLVVLGVLLLLVAVVLFVPVCYRFEGSYLDKADGTFEVRWVPVLMKAVVKLVDNRPQYVVKLFGGVVMTNTDQKLSWIGRKLFSGAGEEPEEDWEEEFEPSGGTVDEAQSTAGQGDGEEKTTHERQQEEAGGESGDHLETESGRDGPREAEVDESEEILRELLEENGEEIRQEADQSAGVIPVLEPAPKEGQAEPENSVEAGQDPAQDGSAEEKASEETSGFRAKLGKLTDKAKQLKKKKDSFEKLMGTRQFRKAKKDVLVYVRRLLKIILPYRFRGRLRFGAEDPSVTGQVFGILAMLYPVYGDRITVIPEFTEKCLEAEGKGKGRIFVISIVILAIRIICNKNLIKTAKKAKNIMEA